MEPDAPHAPSPPAACATLPDRASYRLRCGGISRVLVERYAHDTSALAPKHLIKETLLEVQTTLYYITTTSHHITSHHITSHHITSHHITTTPTILIQSIGRM